MRDLLTLIVFLGLSVLIWKLVVSREAPDRSPDNSKVVVVYTAHDKIYSEPLLKEFEEATGITVKPVFDTESTKTIGLVQRLMRDRDNPQCDVFWNNEIVNTLVLARQGLLERYRSPNAKGIPDQFRTDFWTGFGARARILIVNTDNLKPEDYPRNGFDFTQPKWKGRFGIAKPLFGTTSTHMAVLFSQDADKARAYLKALKVNDVHVEDGNGAVMRAVAEGRLDAGWTDTDDATLARVRDGKPVEIVVPDADDPAGGAILIPNTVMLMAGAPHSDNGKKLIDFLLRPETEARLARMASAQIPLHPGVERPDFVLDPTTFPVAPIDWNRAADAREEANRFSQELLLR